MSATIRYIFSKLKKLNFGNSLFNLNKTEKLSKSCLLIIDYNFFIMGGTLESIKENIHKLEDFQNISVIIPKLSIINLKRNANEGGIPYLIRSKKALEEIDKFDSKEFNISDKKIKFIKSKDDVYRYPKNMKWFIEHIKRYEIEIFAFSKQFIDDYDHIFIATVNPIINHLSKKVSNITAINIDLGTFNIPYQNFVSIDTNFFIDNDLILEVLVEDKGYSNLHISHKVIDELCNIAKNNRGKYKKEVANQAKVVIDDIDFFLKKYPNKIFITKYNKRSKNKLANKFKLVFNAKGSDGNDNFILADALKLKEISKKVILLSKDKEFAKKARENGIEVYSKLKDIPIASKA